MASVIIVDQEILELEELIVALDTAYEAGDDCIHPLTGKVVSDPEYDLLRKQLQELKPDSAILKDVTASKLMSGSKKVKHNPPMVSISKAIGTLQDRTDILKDFIEKVSQELNYPDAEKELVQAYKRDGVAVALYYEEGKLVRAGLRPRNGTDGEDVTENIQYVEGVPLELWEHDKDGNRVRFLPVTCSIRGELECKKSVFRKIVGDWQNPKFGLDSEPKNPRNYTAGSIRQFCDPKVTKERKLSFTGYSIFSWTSKDQSLSAPYKTEIDRAKYCNAKLRIPYVQVRPFRHVDLKTLEDICLQMDYEVDGIVISVNNLEDSEQMGTHGGSATGNPKSKIAWKFAEESVIVEVKDIVWTPGRTGKLTPVLVFDGVQLDGTTVSQCTGHSLGFLDGSSKASLGEITKWSKIRIIKSGKIIPKVIEIVSKGFQQNSAPPDRCPSCDSKLQHKQGEDGKNLVCLNEFCGERACANIVHFLSTLGVKGIGDSIVATLLEKKLIEDFSGLYDLSVKDVRSAGFTERESALIVARLLFCPDPAHQSDSDLVEFCNTAGDELLEIPAAQLFAALGIPGAGKTAGQTLVAHFGTFEAIRAATWDELLEVDGLGEISATAIIGYFIRYRSMIDALLQRIKPLGKKMGKLSGQTFVFSGGFDGGGKQAWEKKVLDEGAVVSGSVGKSTNYLVVGTDAGSKVDKAKQIGVKMLTPSELEKML